MTHNDILKQLNDMQRQAVEYADGPQLVIAGAGSGKTRVLTYKIAWLVDVMGLNPWNILALTFTNKAADEMKERIAGLVGADLARYLNMGTFHSIFARILRTEAEKIGFTSNFTIYDQSDSRSLTKSIIKEMQLDDKVYKPNSVSDKISMAKNFLVSPGRFATCSLYDAKKPQEAEVFRRYVERCRTSNAMDFDDLLVYTHSLLSTHEDLRQKYADRFRYVLVDEYQDTNYAQQAIIWLITKDHGQVCVVGDDAQSIYSFRGASIDNIIDFRKQYKDARLFKLEQNYRSTQLIVAAANSLIKKNERQIPKDVFSKNEDGEKVTLKPLATDREEAFTVCNDIMRIKRKEGGVYSDFAILYRTNSQSRPFEEQLRKEGIPYKIFGGMSFYQRKEIKDAVAYFRVVVNPNDEEALRRIINYPARGIGDTTLAKIVDAADRNGVPLWDVIANPAHFGASLSGATTKRLADFKALVDGWCERAADDDAYTLGQDIIRESGMAKDIYSSREPEYLARQENIEEFIGGIHNFVDSRQSDDMEDKALLTHFLQEIALLTDVESNEKDDTPKVALMTIHAAKGLEFQTVFIVGLEENIFPSPMCTESVRSLEEERRLLYVAITRAEKHCIMTCAQSRFRYGRMEYDTPSRFIKDIDSSLIKVVGNKDTVQRPTPSVYGQSPRLSSWGQQNPRPVADSFLADPKPRIVMPAPKEKPIDPFAPQFRSQLDAAKGRRLKPIHETTCGSGVMPKEGARIVHDRFGTGTVTKIEGTGENTKATVAFEKAGTKQLILRFARFTILDD